MVTVFCRTVPSAISGSTVKTAELARAADRKITDRPQNVGAGQRAAAGGAHEGETGRHDVGDGHGRVRWCRGCRTDRVDQRCRPRRPGRAARSSRSRTTASVIATPDGEPRTAMLNGAVPSSGTIEIEPPVLLRPPPLVESGRDRDAGRVAADGAGAAHRARRRRGSSRCRRRRCRRSPTCRPATRRRQRTTPVGSVAIGWKSISRYTLTDSVASLVAWTSPLPEDALRCRWRRARRRRDRSSCRSARWCRRHGS